MSFRALALFVLLTGCDVFSPVIIEAITTEETGVSASVAIASTAFDSPSIIPRIGDAAIKIVKDGASASASSAQWLELRVSVDVSGQRQDLGNIRFPLGQLRKARSSSEALETVDQVNLGTGAALDALLNFCRTDQRPGFCAQVRKAQ